LEEICGKFDRAGGTQVSCKGCLGWHSETTLSLCASLLVTETICFLFEEFFSKQFAEFSAFFAARIQQELESEKTPGRNARVSTASSCQR
jgi:hypothetical protein